MAVKKLHDFDFFNPEAVEEFRREAALMQLLGNHPNVRYYNPKKRNQSQTENQNQTILSPTSTWAFFILSTKFLLFSPLIG